MFKYNRMGTPLKQDFTNIFRFHILSEKVYITKFFPPARDIDRSVVSPHL